MFAQLGGNGQLLPDRMQRLGFLGSVVQLVLAAALGLLASRPDAFPNPPEPIPRGVAIGLLYAVPGLTGSLGVIAARRSILAATALLAAIGSVVAFSGVTLVFLVPALLFAAASVAPGSARRGGGRVASPLLAVVVLVSGAMAGLALLAMTETRCWEARQTVDGITYRSISAGQTISAPEVIASGCDTGALTVRGATAGGIFALVAVAAAGLPLLTPARRPAS